MADSKSQKRMPNYFSLDMPITRLHIQFQLTDFHDEINKDK
jgi:hypothetical protein